MSLDDKATELEEFPRETALKMRKPEQRKTGVCFECGETTKHSYCSVECRWIDERRTSQAKGKV